MTWVGVGVARLGRAVQLPAILLCMLLSSAAAEPFIIAVGDDYPPYVDRDLPGGGTALAVMFEAADRAGFTPVVEWYSWTRAKTQVESDAAHVTLPYSYTADRAARFYATLPVVEVSEYIFTQSGTAMPDGPDDFVGLTGCYPEGYQAAGFLRQMWASGEARRHTVFTMDLCFRMLNAGRVDFVLAAAGEAAKVLKREGIDASMVKRSPRPYSSIPHMALMSRDLPDGERVIARLNDALSEMRLEGRLE